MLYFSTNSLGFFHLSMNVLFVRKLNEIFVSFDIYGNPDVFMDGTYGESMASQRLFSKAVDCKQSFRIISK